MYTKNKSKIIDVYYTKRANMMHDEIIDGYFRLSKKKKGKVTVD
jgi:hypothetical protein